jgi:hypothetical protein
MKYCLLLLSFSALCFSQTDLPGPIRSLPSENHASNYGFGGWDAAQAFWAGFIAPPTGLTANRIWQLPSVDGTVGQCLGSVAAFTLGWEGCSGAWTYVTSDPTGTCTPPLAFQYNTVDGTPFGCDGSWSGWMTLNTGQTVTATKIFTANQQIASGYYLQFPLAGSIGNAGVPNSLYFADTSNNAALAILNTGVNWGAGAGETVLFKSSVSIVAQAPTMNGLAVFPYFSGATADVVDFYGGTGGSTNIWSLTPAGVMTVVSCVGCAPSNMMTLNTAQTVTATKTFSANQEISSGYYLQFPLAGSIGNAGISNSLYFADTSNNAALAILNTGVNWGAGAGETVLFKSAIVVSSQSPTMNGLVVQPYFSGATADVVDFYGNPGGATLIWSLTPAGVMTVPTVNITSQISGTYNLAGNETVTGNFYIRSFSGVPSCTGVANGWMGYDTATNQLWICNGGTAFPH